MDVYRSCLGLRRDGEFYPGAANPRSRTVTIGVGLPIMLEQFPIILNHADGALLAGR